MKSYWRTLSREVLWFNSCLYKDQSGCSGEVSEERQQGDTFEAFSKMMDWISAANCTLKTSLKPDRVTLKKKKKRNGNRGNRNHSITLEAGKPW